MPERSLSFYVFGTGRLLLLLLLCVRELLKKKRERERIRSIREPFPVTHTYILLFYVIIIMLLLILKRSVIVISVLLSALRNSIDDRAAGGRGFINEGEILGCLLETWVDVNEPFPVPPHSLCRSLKEGKGDEGSDSFSRP